MSGKPKKPAPRPSKRQILEFIRQGPGRVGKREIARAFSLGAADRVWLKEMLKELQSEGAVGRTRARRLVPAGTLPEVALLDVVETDIDGELIARPVEWKGEGPPPRVILTGEGKGRAAGLGHVGVGDRVLARVKRIGEGLFEGRFMRLVHVAPEQVVGVFTALGPAKQVGGRIQPTDRRQRYELVVQAHNTLGAASGELVLADVLPGRGHGLREAKVRERLGPIGSARSLSLVAIHTHDIPTVFSPETLAAAKAAKPVALGHRTDLRAVPLVTIDPEDARDHDDAVWAAPDDDPDNRGGWHVIVAIADVAHYVRPGGALDKDARLRGNSVYFPDRVVPMLPEALSADLCSLVEGEPRACLAAHMWFDAHGNKRKHRFSRGLMRCAASLHYGQVQRARDGEPDAVCAPLMATVIEPLYGAFAALRAARERREPLALELPERRVLLGADGHIRAVVPRPHYDSHRLIEEFMIAANVCAAETLEEARQPCMYRVHDEPAHEKVEALREFLDSLGLRFAKGQVLKPALFNRVLRHVEGTPQAHLVNQVVLRSQSQAAYSPDNIGHFGLALRRYAHFTSPIRRYADLLVHRALIGGLRLGDGGLSGEEAGAFAAIADHISMTERRAMTAERDALDRFTAAYMADRVGATFAGRIDGVTRFGLFVELAESGADGLIPISALGDDFYIHDERLHALVGRRTGRTFRLGDEIEVRLAEAELVTGSLRLELVSAGGERRARRGRTPPARRAERRSERRRRP